MRTTTEIANWNAIATLIVIRARVKRHMEVTDKMDDVADGIGA
jgi:hypothetical protein